MTFAPIEEFSNLFKAEPIKVVLSEPMTEKIKQINIKTPIGTLIGNIKTIDENGHQPSLLATNATEVFPKLVFPFQTQPKLATVEYWASKQIIPLQEIFSFLDTAGHSFSSIPYDQEFSLQDFLKLGSQSEVDYPTMKFPSFKKIVFRDWGKRDKGKWINAGFAGMPNYIWKKETSENYEIIRTIELPYKTLYQTSVSPVGDKQELYERSTSFKDIEITPIGVSGITEAFKAILQIMTENFWKDMEFEGATKVTIKDGQKIEEVLDEEIFKLSQKYSGQDRYAVTTNVWIAWKR
ncbi:hypothetical protein [Williamsoniiplasma luminosum]|uniref:Uncharacterized protein n=1 Tax=Williamsoniiplasma luminosum TaxID=214888 RepID=A0A2S0NJ61_9MOLU|nr:hypothetical protein [Williamsoniiplasma luminosum]AVP49053.1 MAG: hypothetical protein C5T88_00435 [Williamsoniiplasma luminosum]